jgi:hypothetical protein
MDKSKLHSLMDEWKAMLVFHSSMDSCMGNLHGQLITKYLHLVAFELHICLVKYDTISTLRVSNEIATNCLITLMLEKYHKLQMSITIQKSNYKPNCKTPSFFIVERASSWTFTTCIGPCLKCYKGLCM